MKYIWTIMSNFDHKIEDWAEEKLKEWDCYWDYPWMNFFWRNVRFEDWNFICEIMQYSSHIDTIKWDSLQKIMDKTCKKYWKE